MTIPAVWFNGSRGIWDHQMLIDMFLGTLSKIPRRFEYNEIVRPGYNLPEDVKGGILVVQARCHVGEADYIKSQLDRWNWSILICAGDEEASFPWRKLEAGNRLIWAQCPMPPTHDDADYYIPTGARPTTREVIRQLWTEDEPWPDERGTMFMFAGQNMNEERNRCMNVLSTIPGGNIKISNGFGQGIPYIEYLTQMLDAKIVVSPSGNYTPDCFRAFEAMECGALPINSRHSAFQPDFFNYWDYIDRFSPLPTRLKSVVAWSEFREMLLAYQQDPVSLQHDTNSAGAWWLAKKREMAARLQDDVMRLSGTSPEHTTTLRDRVTVLMPTNCIGDHPSTAIIEDSIRRIRAYPLMADCEILVMVDALRPEQADRRADYEEYKRKLIWLCNWHPDFQGVLPVLFENHSQQAEMAKRVLPMVRTPLVFYVEHDTYPMGEIRFDQIADSLMAYDSVNCIRLHNFDRILPEHEYLYTDCKPVEIHGCPVVKTTAWSQRPHMAKATTYARWLEDYTTPGQNIFIEHALYGKSVNSPWETFKCAIYSPTGGDILRSGHTDGRKGKVPS